jgi:hypothetical protein
MGIRWPAEASPILHPPAGAIGLVGLVGAHLGPELLFEAPLGLLEALRAAARHRLRVRRALGLQAPLGLAQPPAATLCGRELLRQLVAARLAIELVLGRVDRPGLLDDLPGQLLEVEILVARRVRLHLRAVDRDHPDLRQPAARAQRQHLAEQARDRVLVALDEPREGRVVRALLRCKHPEGDVFLARALDHARGPPARIGIKQQRDHHRRVRGRPTAPIHAIGRIEGFEVHLADGVDDKPRKVPRRQPLTDIGRHQKRLLAITRDKALAHHEIALTARTTPDIRDSHAWMRELDGPATSLAHWTKSKRLASAGSYHRFALRKRAFRCSGRTHSLVVSQRGRVGPLDIKSPPRRTGHHRGS